MRLPPTGNEIGANSKPFQTFLDIYIYYIYMQAEIQLRLISLVLVRAFHRREGQSGGNRRREITHW